MTNTGQRPRITDQYGFVTGINDLFFSQEWSQAAALDKDNTALLRNFLDSLELADIKPSRFVLQTGGKNYGMHIGRVRTPLVESEPQPRHLQTNSSILKKTS
ncbi:hypothetical protein N8I77_013402 [Diaporthe amygdali]|uniref:Uncharacterized protein n=1 Tax=Phomopsis amygdali TaxID=1214568 RepID=A0AAD9S1C6_PHOAM|nr:hypothetical protein N8I77_013402 [Diaporthe amygdali]